MGPIESTGISWNANQQFYEHMKTHVWDKLAEADRELCELEGLEKLNALEKQYAAVKHWFDMIRFYARDLEPIETLFAKIEEISKGVEFSHAALTHAQNSEIKELIAKIRSKLWMIISTTGMTPSKRDMTGADVWL
jgi:hypothetical protein